MDQRLTFMEFFAGGGMARAGLGSHWRCVFANDFDRKKGETYRANWGSEEMHVGDVRTLKASDLPTADLVWASFPCQDLSLAGGGAGLRGDRSGTFWPFWNLVRSMGDTGLAPRAIILENVVGTLSSHGGEDFRSLCSAIAAARYTFGALIIDARHFVPQSRPRLFIVAFRSDDPACEALSAPGPTDWHTPALVKAYQGLNSSTRERWRWWSLPAAPLRNSRFADLIEDEPSDVPWHSPAETKRLLAMMSPLNLAKVEQARLSPGRQVGAVYKRTRIEEGIKVQRAEVRFDDVAGCLRTPAGGSSRQVIIVADNGTVRSRLISSRETARLMGLPDTYKLPAQYNEAYHLTGDGVAVPVVRFLAAHLLEPVLGEPNRSIQAA
ncbi:DNA cytosine methyltransferase [Phreatobacter oligotrophus]|nr:DNA cytosine methyltransferase [Phreatobacter oligotrophus]MBX9992188.1 DNA cytosine methyltransferase [Phreatobacter oligotrophus]